MLATESDRSRAVDAVEERCRNFRSIGLDKMDKVKLMNRREIKYTVHRNLLPFLLDKLSSSYDILEIGGRNIMPYKSVYFDTRDYRLYTSHQNGKLNRYKVRKRRYELTGTEYLEIKFKSNKKRTIKKRILLQRSGGNIDESSLFLKANLPSSLQDLEQKLVVRYRRLMLVDKARSERVTIDMDLSCSSSDRESRYGRMAVIEIKHGGSLKNSVIAALLADLGIKSISFSKYCLGISELYGDVKTNFIKIKMRQLERALSLQSRLALQQ